MPMATKEKQIEYQRNWMRKRRAEWLAIHGPCVLCGSNERLEVDHIDRRSKVDHRVWSWSKKRREDELAKCQILCKKCHISKTIKDFGWHKCGTLSQYDRGCRCRTCTDVKVAAVTAWKKKNSGVVQLAE